MTTPNQIVNLAKVLKEVYENEEQNYSTSPEYKQMIKKMKNLNIDAFSLPTEFPAVITQGRIHQEDKLRVSLFFIPKGFKFPIHDHPNMFVICKVLMGKINYSQYSLKDRSFQFKIPKLFVQKKNVKFPCLSASKNLKMLVCGDMGYVTPQMNLHSFEALENSIYIDVICPDYDKVQTFLNMYDQVKTNSNKNEITLQMKQPRLTCLPLINIAIQKLK